MCASKKHSKKCGCLSNNLIAVGKRNHFSALKQSKNCADEYARRMKVLGKYHSRDIHQWTNDKGEEDECGFHQLIVCSCGKCDKSATDRSNNRNASDGDDEDESDTNQDASSDGDYGDDQASQDEDGDDETAQEGDDEPSDTDSSDCDEGLFDDSDEEEDLQFKCTGKAYSTRLVLTCDLHALLYEIECHRIAKKAKDVVHEEKGRGHSNLPESKFNVLTRFRSKSVNLHQLHYEFITNTGLCQSNMTFMFKQLGQNYHWLKQLYTLLRLPIPDGIEDIWAAENSRRMTHLTKKKTDKAKSQRVKQKQQRLKEIEQR